MCSLDTCEMRETPEDCQQLCQETDGCVEFTWALPCEGNVDIRKMCWLKNQTNTDPLTVADRVSGPKFCGKQPRIPSIYNV